MTRIACLAIVVVTIVLFAVAVHRNPGYDVLACFFTRPDCSTAVSTYGLVAFGALAFAAALDAGNWARKTFEHERAPVVSVEQCYASCDQRRCEPQYFTDVEEGFVGVCPSEPVEFQIYDLDVQNVGRTALGTLSLGIVVRRKDGASSDVRRVSIGALSAGARLHATIFFAPQIVRSYEFEWLDAKGKLPRLGSAEEIRAVESFFTGAELRIPFTGSWQRSEPSENTTSYLEPQSPES